MADVLNMSASGELFHTATGTAFADLLINGHRQTWPIRSNRFRGWLRRRYYQKTGSALSTKAVRSALDLLEARVQIGPDGWRGNGRPPVRFRRPAGLLPTPLPQRRRPLEQPACLPN